MSLSSLFKLRQSLQHKIDLHHKIVDRYDATVSNSTLQVAKEQVSLFSRQLEDLHDKIIIAIDEDSDIEDATKAYADINTTLLLMEEKLLTLTCSNVSVNCKPASSNFRLERIKVPVFNGSFHQWEEFRDLFTSAVHENGSLSGAEKMVYLKGSLSGEALSIVHSFPTTEASYNLAWDLVKKRYSNEREIAFAHLKRFYDMQKSQDTSKDLRRMVDVLNEMVRSLKFLNIPVEHWDVILVFWTLRKLEGETRKQWLLTQDTSLPSLEILLEFLEQRSRALDDTLSMIRTGSKALITDQKKSMPSTSKTAYVTSTRKDCADCGQSHPLHSCEIFVKKSFPDRKDLVFKNRLCFNCFARGHSAPDCGSKFSCKQCGSRHHTLLHFQKNKSNLAQNVIKPVTQDGSGIPKIEVTSSHCSNPAFSASHVLMETALAEVVNSFGAKVTVRVFVDKGSDAEFVTADCVRRLGLKKFGNPVSITGLGGVNCGSTLGKVKLTLFSKVKNYSLAVCAEVIDKVTRGPLPQFQGQSQFKHLGGLLLADPQYWKPQPVDLILGARYASKIKTGGLIHGPPETPSAEETHFGWLLSGTLPDSSRCPDDSLVVLESHRASVASSHSTPVEDEVKWYGGRSCDAEATNIWSGSEELRDQSSSSTALASADNTDASQDSVNRTLIKFWEYEEAEFPEVTRSTEDLICEQNFCSNTERQADGRYEVQLPFREIGFQLGDSFVYAQKRFNSIERRIHHHPYLQKAYAEYFQHNLRLGIMEIIPPSEMKCHPSKCYYMPYSDVTRDSSSTTKVRIVFDCSAKTMHGPSLNNLLYPGPKLQVDLFPLLLRFRSFPFAISADICKFFTQINVAKKHRDFLRLLYRETPSHPILHIRSTRLVFGLTSAPYLSIRCLHQLLEDEGADITIRNIIQEDILVDNVLSGAFSLSAAVDLQQQLRKIMERGQFLLRKWASNIPEVILDVPEDERESKSELHINETAIIPTLGLMWNPCADTFTLLSPKCTSSVHPTKRGVLSTVAQLFDPLGWTSPVSVRAKILLQDLWKAKCDWDAPLLPSFTTKWRRIIQDVELLPQFCIDRCYFESGIAIDSPMQLIGFCDASNVAYAAVVYSRVTTPSSVKVAQVGAKTKVAPVKGDTTPRLELSGARLLTRLLATIKQSLRVPVSQIICYTDSTSVCGWVSASDHKEVFVKNRVRYIQQTLPTTPWLHISGSQNPADAASRGISVHDLLKSTLWSKGPQFLHAVDYQVHSYRVHASQTHANFIIELIQRYSSFSRLRRVMGWILRFVEVLKSGTRNPQPLTVAELQSALKVLINEVQKEAFHDDIQALSLRQYACTKKMKPLCPFLDEDGLIRVGGRFRNIDVNKDKKHPYLLPKKHHISLLVGRHFHEQNQHAGPRLLLSLLREKYWIVGAPTLVKKIVRMCVICHRCNPHPLQQVMADLPSPRLSTSRPFSHTGMDFAGPFYLCIVPGRKPKISKMYICVFVCMAVKAVHLELVGDLSAVSFLAALRRFSSRRGLPHTLYSDGGTNFLGAKSELDRVKSIMTASDFNKTITESSSETGINFRFNPPASPHHGDLWEAVVKSLKYHLSRIVDRHLSIEEFGTVLCQIEAALNSRPLIPLSSDPSEFGALTPAHFLIGNSLSSIPEKDLTEKRTGLLKRWAVAQQISQHFSKPFQNEYLDLLQSRPKWLTSLPNVEIGTLVLLKQSSAAFSSHKWNLARVTQVFRGSDGNVRVVEVKTPSGALYRRSIVNISPLPISQ